MRTAILGATGYIGESLGRLWAKESADALFLFARRPEALDCWPDHVRVCSADAFDAGDFDLVINAIGAGDPSKVCALGEQIVDITREWDERILGRLQPHGRYVFLSSGAVHAPEPQPAYTRSKRSAEAAHRAQPDRHILDLRVFGYAEPNIDLDGGFFLAELVRSVSRSQAFRTTRADMGRDYAGARELADLIGAWLGAGAHNGALDLYTLAPVSKMELLDLAQAEFDLTVEWIDDVQAPPTGHKPAYFSRDRAAEIIGFRPGRTSTEVVRNLLEAATA
jgi:nucleoside-diphosphate-sugar epimerase